MMAKPLKPIYLVEKLPESSDEAFAEHWTMVHAPLAANLPGLLSYSINLHSTEQRGLRPFDGYAKLEFGSWEEAKAAWASAAGQAVADDGLQFMTRAQPLIVEEGVVIARTNLSVHR